MKDQAIYDFTLMMADSTLIMSHRLSEWNGHGPDIELDIAVTNITLDLLGQSRFLFQYAATLHNAEGKGLPTTEDSLAFLRDAPEFKNVLLSELPNHHWGYTILKLFFFVHWQQSVYSHLLCSQVKPLSAIAEKSLKETAYHIRWTEDWVKRLGDGTEESHTKMQQAIEEIWPYTGELLQPEPYESSVYETPSFQLFEEMRTDWMTRVKNLLDEATISVPGDNSLMHKGGKKGLHTEHLGYILAEMQFLQRAYPGCEW